jgi:hypothetical protein
MCPPFIVFHVNVFFYKEWMVMENKVPSRGFWREPKKGTIMYVCSWVSYPELFTFNFYGNYVKEDTKGGVSQVNYEAWNSKWERSIPTGIKSFRINSSPWGVSTRQSLDWLLCNRPNETSIWILPRADSGLRIIIVSATTTLWSRYLLSREHWLLWKPGREVHSRN